MDGSASDDVVVDVAEACPHLEKLDVSTGNTTFSVADAGLLAVAQHCTQLRVLGIYSNRVIHQLSKRLHNLSTFDTSGCANLSDAAIVSLASATLQMVNSPVYGH